MQPNVFAPPAPSQGAEQVLEGVIEEEPPLKLQIYGGRLKLPDAALDVGSLPPSINVLALSNTAGYLAAATSKGFVLAEVGNLRKAFTAAPAHEDTPYAPLRTITTPSQVVSLHFTGRDAYLAVSLLAGGVAIYQVSGLVDNSQTDPVHVFPVPTPLVVLPNPASERADLLALLGQDGRLGIVNLATRDLVATFGEQLTTCCWSVLGKQIITGGAGCQLQQFSPEGQLKSVTPAPSSVVTTASKVLDVRWLENNILVVTYGTQTAGGDADSSVYGLVRSQGLNTFARLDDRSFPSFDYPSRENRRLMSSLKDWPPYKHLVFAANAASTQLTIFSYNKDTNAWGTVDVDEASQPILPTATAAAASGHSGHATDPLPVGAVIDLGSTDPPNPFLVASTSEGLLVAWRVVNDVGGRFPGLLMAASSGEMSKVGSTDGMEMSTPTSIVPETASPFGPSSSASAFTGAAVSTSTAFPAAGATAFGSTSVPSIGKPAATTPSSGGFGQSAFGAFGKPSFGAPSSLSFSGQRASQTQSTPTTSVATAPSAFAASAGAGFSSFASASQPSSTSDKVAFAQPQPVSSTASPPAFGAPSTIFGQSSATMSSSPFGTTQSPAQDAKPMKFGTFATPGNSTFSFGGGAPKSSFSFAGGATPRRDGQADDDEEEMASERPSGALGGTAPRSILADPDDLEPTGKSGAAGLSFGNMGLGQAVPSSSNVGQAKAFSFAASTPPPSAFVNANVNATAPAFQAPPPAAPSSKPVAASGTASPAFGASSFGQSGFGQSAFGRTGFTGFGSPASTIAPPSTISSASTPPVSSAFSAFASKGATSSFASGSRSSQDPETSAPSAFARPSSASPLFGTADSGSTPPSTTSASLAPFGQTAAAAVAPSTADKMSPLRQSNEVDPGTQKPSPATIPTPHATAGMDASGVDARSAAKADKAAEKILPENLPSSLDGASGSSFLPDSKVSTEVPKSHISEAGGATETPTQRPDEQVSVLKSAEETKTASKAPVDTSIRVPPVTMGGTTPASGMNQKSKDTAAAKSLFGLASSPPVSSKGLSLLERLGPPVHQDLKGTGSGESDPELPSEEGEEADAPDEEYEDEDEDDDEFDDEEGDDYDDEESQDLEDGEDGDGEADDAQDEDEETSAAQAETLSGNEDVDIDKGSRTSTTSKEPPSLLARLSAAPVATESHLRDSPAPPAPVPKASNASSSVPPVEAVTRKESETLIKPSSVPLPSNTTEAVTTPTSGAPVFSFAKQATSPSLLPSKGLFGLPASAPRASSPLASSPVTSGSSVLTSSTKPVHMPFATPSHDATPTHTGALPSTKASSSVFAFKPPTSAPLASPQPEAKPATQSNILDPKNVPSAPLPMTPTAQYKATGNKVVDQHLELVALMRSDLDMLKSTLKICSDHLHQLKQRRQVATDPHALHPSPLSLGDLPVLVKATDDLGRRIDSINQTAQSQKRRLAELQSQSAKIQQKQQESGRFLKSKTDPDVAKRVRVRALGPEQVENQRRLRKSGQILSDGLGAVEGQVSRLKERMSDDTSARPAFRAPSLDSIQRAVRNISSAVSVRARELDGLSRQLAALEVRNSPEPKLQLKALMPPSSPSPHPVNGPGHSSPSASPSKPSNVELQEIADKSRRLFAAQRDGAALHDAVLAIRSRPLLTRSPAPPAACSLDGPLPAQKAVPIGRSPPQATASLTLQAPSKIEFSFSPIAGAASADSFGGSGGSSRQRTSSRTHSSAVKVQQKEDAAIKITPGGGFSFGPLPSVLTSASSNRGHSLFSGFDSSSKPST